jgi:uncharacterized protein
MALLPRPHGVTHTLALSAAAYLAVSASSIWGVVVTAPDADAVKFPLDTPVLVDDVAAALEDAGEEGTLAGVLQAVGSFGQSLGVVVRVAVGAGEDPEEIADATDANVIAGFAKLRLAEQTVGVRPVVLGAPGLDTAAVTAALALLSGYVDGFAYAAAIGETPAEVQTYRQTFSSDGLMLIDRNFTAFDSAAAEDAVSFAAAWAIGLRVFLDRTVGYHKTISNVPFSGPLGIINPRNWSEYSADTEMGLINGADVTGLIMRGGARFWGNRTCSSNLQLAFESSSRTAKALRRVIVEGLFPFIDQPLRASLAIDIIEAINALFRREVRAGRLIGAEAFLAEGNTPDQLAAGKLRIGYRFTPVAPLEDLGVEAVITDEFYADFAQLVGAAA